MKTVKDELEDIMRKCRNNGWASEAATRRILERFEVTPKPVISLLLLGLMVTDATTGRTYEMRGEWLLGKLDEAGLEIVRKEAK